MRVRNVLFSILAGLSGPAAAQAAQDDSLQVEDKERPSYLEERMRALGGGEHAGARIPVKVVSGSLMGVGVAAFGTAVALVTSDLEAGSAHTGVGAFLFGLSAGSAIGFPLGVTYFDPHDSLPITLLAGVIPGFTGYYLLWIDQENAGTAFPLMYISPLIGSLVASELSRKPPEDRRVSFGLSPTLDGGLSASTTLNF